MSICLKCVEDFCFGIACIRLRSSTRRRQHQRISDKYYIITLKMPAKVRIKIIRARNLPIMSKTHESTDAFVEVKIGQEAYKTDVCWRSLDPEWTNEWFKFELSDQTFLEEPVQIRVMDHDTYSSHDAIGKIQLRLPQLLNIRISEVNGQHHLRQWFLIYDTLHGHRGSLFLELVILPFGELAAPPLLCCSNYPYSIHVQRIFGLVDCAVLTDDPEYQWMDRIRASRTTNESRQVLFSRMSGALRRRMTLKARRVGANAILGYREMLDICCDAGVVLRAIGTAARVERPSAPAAAATQRMQLKPTQQSQSRQVRAATAVTGGGNEAVTKSPTTLTQQQQQQYSFFIDDEALIATNNDNFDLGNGQAVNDDSADLHWLSTSCEFPYITATSLPEKLVRRIGGLVSTRIVKKLSELEEINTHGVEYRWLPDSWFTDVRQEIRRHMLACDCNGVYGYQELVYPVPDEDLVIISAKATAAELVCDLATSAIQSRTSAELFAGCGVDINNNNSNGAFDRNYFYAANNLMRSNNHHQTAATKTELLPDEGTLLPPTSNISLPQSTTTVTNSTSKTRSAVAAGGSKAIPHSTSSSAIPPTSTTTTATTTNAPSPAAAASSCHYAATPKRHDLFTRVVPHSHDNLNGMRNIVPSVIVSNTEPLTSVDFVGRGNLIHVRVVKNFRKGFSDRSLQTLPPLQVPSSTVAITTPVQVAFGSTAPAITGLVGAVTNARQTYRAWNAARRRRRQRDGENHLTKLQHHHHTTAALTVPLAAAAAAASVIGGAASSSLTTRERRSEMDVVSNTAGAGDKRRLTELLSFIEFELYSQLIGKLKVLGLNSVWSLNETFWVGKHRVVAVACGTAAYVHGLGNRPALPLVNSIQNHNDLMMMQSANNIERQLMIFRQRVWKVLGIRHQQQQQSAAAAATAEHQQGNKSGAVNMRSSSGNRLRRERTISESHAATTVSVMNGHHNAEDNNFYGAGKRVKWPVNSSHHHQHHHQRYDIDGNDVYHHNHDRDDVDHIEQVSLNSATTLTTDAAVHRQRSNSHAGGGVGRNLAASPVLRIELDSMNDTRRLVELLGRFVSPSVALITCETMPHQHHVVSHNRIDRAANNNSGETASPFTEQFARPFPPVAGRAGGLKPNSASAANISANAACCGVTSSSIPTGGGDLFHNSSGGGGALHLAPAWMLQGEPLVRLVVCRVATLGEVLSDLMRYFRVMTGRPQQQLQQQRRKKAAAAARSSNENRKQSRNINNTFPSRRRLSGHNLLEEHFTDVAANDDTAAPTTSSSNLVPSSSPSSKAVAGPGVRILGLQFCLDTIEEADDDDVMLLTIQGTIFRPPTALDQLLSSLRSVHNNPNSAHAASHHVTAGPGGAGNVVATRRIMSAVGGGGGTAAVGGGPGGGSVTSRIINARSHSRELNALHLLHTRGSVVPAQPSQLARVSSDLVPLGATAAAALAASTTTTIPAMSTDPHHAPPRAGSLIMSMLHQQSLSSTSSTAANSPLHTLNAAVAAAAAAAAATSLYSPTNSIKQQQQSGMAPPFVLSRPVRFGRSSLEQHVLAAAARRAAVAVTSSNASATASAVTNAASPPAGGVAAGGATVIPPSTVGGGGAVAASVSEKVAGAAGGGRNSSWNTAASFGAGGSSESDDFSYADTSSSTTTTSFVYMTTLSYVPAPAKIIAYIGLINFYVIREDIALRESGSSSGSSMLVEKTSQFLHGSLLEFNAMLKSLARAMGGNALVSLTLRQVQLMGRSQVLCHLAGDVVQIE